MGKKAGSGSVLGRSQPKKGKKGKSEEEEEAERREAARQAEALRAERERQAQIEKLKLQFEKLDKNGDGQLSYEELGAILRRGDPSLTDQDLGVLFKGVDKNGDGNISFDEFIDHIFTKSRISLHDAQQAVRASGRSWSVVDSIRFDRAKGGDQTISAADQEWIMVAPTRWQDAKQRKVGERSNRMSIQRSSLAEEAAPPGPGQEDEEEQAAIKFQSAFRGFQARRDVERKRAWEIYQAVEYKVEHNQTSMKDFLSQLLKILPPEKSDGAASLDGQMKKGWPYNIKVPKDYDGPTLDSFTIDSMLELLSHYLSQMVSTSPVRLHMRYVCVILANYLQRLEMMHNVRRVSTASSRVITVVGDLHGQLRDLGEIFRLNGAPSIHNPYLFNGDLVDRGEHSLEVALVLFGLAAAEPGAVLVNRGNHEDMSLCAQYGFVDEIAQKYRGAGKSECERLTTLFGKVFANLPLATIIDEDIFVVHGGISDKTYLSEVEHAPRGLYAEMSNGVPPKGTEQDYIMLSDMMWSDPIDNDTEGVKFRGVEFNDTRGLGAYWGEDHSVAWLKAHKLALIVRSHECVEEGFEFKHSGRVMTLFSASNYYEDGSNVGAYCVVHRDRGVTLQQFCVKNVNRKDMSKNRFKRSTAKMEGNAIEQLRHVLLSCKQELQAAFEREDPEGSGIVSLNRWAEIVQDVTQVRVPWVTAHSGLVRACEDGQQVLWRTCLETASLPTKNSAMASGLYRNLGQMEALFRLLDTDGSGVISVEELRRAAQLVNKSAKKGTSPLSNKELEEIVNIMDIDNDGSVSFHEFIEAMRNMGLT